MILTNLMRQHVTIDVAYTSTRSNFRATICRFRSALSMFSLTYSLAAVIDQFKHLLKQTGKNRYVQRRYIVNIIYVQFQFSLKEYLVRTQICHDSHAIRFLRLQFST